MLTRYKVLARALASDSRDDTLRDILTLYAYSAPTQRAALYLQARCYQRAHLADACALYCRTQELTLPSSRPLPFRLMT